MHDIALTFFEGYLRISVHPGLVQDLTVEEVKIEALTYLERCYPGVGWDKNPCTLYVENWIEKQPYLDVKCFWPPNGSFSEGFSTVSNLQKLNGINFGVAHQTSQKLVLGWC